MTSKRQNAEFPEQADENRRIWNANALWWDEQIGDGNDFQTLLIEPATERLLDVVAGDMILDAACGAGRFARRMAELGARVVAFDYSAEFIARARERTSSYAAVEYHAIDAASAKALLALGSNRFNKAVCTMAIMDMPEIGPLFATLSRLLVPGGAFVFSVTHPCFHSAANQRFAETYEDQPGRHVIRSGVKVGHGGADETDARKCDDKRLA
jgi:ubiquinone/menaquinone biosynthesis C-methylase UbiE